MLQLFKSGRVEAYLVLLLLGILAWYPALKVPFFIEIPAKQMIAYGGFVTLFSQFKVLALAIAIIAALGGAVLANGLSETYEMRTKPNHFTALAYLLFITVFPHNHQLNPALIGNLFILGSWWFVFDTYREEKGKGRVFLSALLLSIGSLVYFPLLMYFVVLLIALAILRPFNWREWCIAIIGLLLPYVYLFSYYYFDNRLIEKLHYIFLEGILDWHWKFQFTYSNIAFLFIGGLFLLLSLFVHVGLMSTGKVKAQKYLTIVFFSLLVSSLIVAITQNWSNSASVMLAVPLAFMFGNFFMQIKSVFFGEICLWLLIAAVAIAKMQLLDLL